MREIIFIRGQNYAQDNLEVKEVSALSKNLSKCPILCFAPDKKLIPCTFRIRGTLVFYVPRRGGEIEREKERERERERGERERERARERARARAREGEREREREKVLAIIFLNRTGQN